jgi:hypothetical protein
LTSVAGGVALTMGMGMGMGWLWIKARVERDMDRGGVHIVIVLARRLGRAPPSSHLDVRGGRSGNPAVPRGVEQEHPRLSSH